MFELISTTVPATGGEQHPPARPDLDLLGGVAPSALYGGADHPTVMALFDIPSATILGQRLSTEAPPKPPEPPPKPPLPPRPPSYSDASEASSPPVSTRSEATQRVEPMSHHPRSAPCHIRKVVQPALPY